ncbi:uncharacterized protein LOC134541459 [Bacillus rossius redtenbacheri]|uniref:uncharacterized protein LOC134541459 n=1 Tax=Bacillus rossius redtenbacheri TaxID=93214 RepID=UPI002FDD8771
MFAISKLVSAEDRETGEILFDQETGETSVHLDAGPRWHVQALDAETGELVPEPPDADRRRIFHVPRSALRDARSPKRRGALRGGRRPPHVTVVSATHRDDDGGEPELQNFYKRVHATCLPMLLLLMFLPAWVAGAYYLAEWILHGVAHHTDRIGCFRLCDPLCYFTSSLCSSCQQQHAARRVIQMQDKRKLRAINKKLEYLSYVNTVIS